MTADRWALTVLVLLGQPLPPLPPIPGRLFKAADDPEPDGMPEWAYLPAAELARREGITRQAAHLRLKKARAAHSTPTEGQTNEP